MERLIEEVGLAVAERVHGGQESVDDVALELHAKLMLRNESTKQLHVESIHVRSTLPSLSFHFTDVGGVTFYRRIPRRLATTSRSSRRPSP